MNGEAATWLERAETIPNPRAFNSMRPWLDAETDAMHKEVLRMSTDKQSPSHPIAR